MATTNENRNLLFDIEGYKFLSTTNANVKKDEVLIYSKMGATYVMPISVMKGFLERLDNDNDLKEMFGQN